MKVISKYQDVEMGFLAFSHPLHWSHLQSDTATVKSANVQAVGPMEGIYTFVKCVRLFYRHGIRVTLTQS